MNREIRQRLKWVLLYEETKNVGLTCRRCGISRPTLRKWLRRYHQNGIKGLESKCRRPHTPPKTKVGNIESNLILKLRKDRNLGARCHYQQQMFQNIIGCYKSERYEDYSIMILQIQV